MKYVCKLCGCTDDKPCILVAVDDAPDRDAYLRAGGAVIIEPGARTREVPCAWLTDDVCSNPVCVEKAYAEARPLAEQIDEALRMEDAA